MRLLKDCSNDTKGIIAMLITCLLVSIMISIVRHLSYKFDVAFIVMMRNIFALAIILPSIARNYTEILGTKKLTIHIWRNCNGFIGQLLWFYSISILPLSDAVSISFLVPIITVPAAIFFLKEKVSGNIFTSLALGFIGVLIIIRPGFNEINISNYILALLTPIFWTISNILIKKLTDTEKTVTMVAYMTIVMTIISIPFGIFYIKPVNLNDLFWFFLLGAISNVMHVFLSIAYSKTKVSLLQPFDYTRLIFTAIISYFAFNELITIWTLLGSVVILFGTILIIPKKITKKDLQNQE